jgi:hypothetical protein
MSIKEIVTDPEILERISDMQQEQEIINQIYAKPLIFKSYSKIEQSLVREKVLKLPSEELVIIYLSFWENLCPYEIAKSLCSTVNRVIKVKVSALSKLKVMMNVNEKHEELSIA